MKEITRITTVQITEIEKVEDDFDFVGSKELAYELMGDIIKNSLDYDDAVVVDVQDFIREIEENE